ncbi:MAG: 16S rRNA (uracil(1498)-N(3))-methyltransferase [Firmicutes bacterium]|nr:16S rRNA (uracil(1498)-N(3))-methyltransferase [Bacillota bacterium]
MQRFMLDEGSSTGSVAADGSTPQPCQVGAAVCMRGSALHHLTRVMRAQVGDQIELVCGGRAFVAEIERVSAGCALVRCLRELLNSESPLRIAWLQGLPKGDKLDAVLRQACEIGAAEVHVFAGRRSIAAVADARVPERVARWRRVLQEEAAVAKRVEPPQVRYSSSLEEALDELPAALPVLAPYELQDGSLPHLSEILAPHSDFAKRLLTMREAALVIGPEGGFDEREIAQLQARGAHLCTLGPRILRTEYAGLAVAAILLYVGEIELRLHQQEVKS